MTRRKRIGADAGTPAPDKEVQTALLGFGAGNEKGATPARLDLSISLPARARPVKKIAYRRITLCYVAGTCRPDPGGLGRWAWLVVDGEGETVATDRGELGAWAGMTAAYAAYVGLIQALTWAEDLGARVELVIDNPAVIAQTLGRAPAPSPLRPLRNEAARRLATAGGVLRYVSPDRNMARRGGPV